MDNATQLKKNTGLFSRREVHTLLSDLAGKFSSAKEFKVGKDRLEELLREYAPRRNARVSVDFSKLQAVVDETAKEGYISARQLAIASISSWNTQPENRKSVIADVQMLIWVKKGKIKFPMEVAARKPRNTVELMAETVEPV